MNTVKCPNCGKENICTNIKCENCGQQLIDEEQMENTNLDELINTQKNFTEHVNINPYACIISGAITIFGGVFFVGISSLFIFLVADNVTKIVAALFAMIGIAIIVNGIKLINRGIKINKNPEYVKTYIDKEKENKLKYEKNIHIIHIVFLLLLIVFLIVFDIIAIKVWNGDVMAVLFSTAIFWIVGVSELIREIQKLKK